MRKQHSSANLKFSFNNLERRALRTAEAIYGHFIAEKLDHVFLLKSLDCILIALGRPLAIEVRSGDENHRVDTRDTTDMIAFDSVVEFPGQAKLRLFFNPDDLKRQCYEILEDASNLLRMIAIAVKQYDMGDISKVGSRINSAVNTLRKRSAKETPLATAKRSPETMSILDAFFDRLDPLMLAVGDACFFPSSIVGNAKCLRLFFFHRLAPGEQSHMRLHPLNSQRNSIAGKYLDAAQNEIWTFDEVISREQVSWIRWPWERTECGASGGWAFRDYLHNLIQHGNEFFANIDDLRRPLTALAVPMHVGRIAWLVVLFVFFEEEERQVELAYYIVQNIVPVLFENIASLARDEYLKLIRANALTSFRSGKFDVGDLNERFTQLSQIFPYKQWYLSSDSNPYGIIAFDEANYLHEREEGPSTGKLFDFEFRPIRPGSVRDRLQDTAHEVQHELKRQQEARHGADEDIGHALKNIVDLTNWTQALSSLRSLDRNYNRLVERGDHQKIRTRLQIANRSLGLFSLVAGLGHFARLAGALERGDYGKFALWHDPDGLRRWNSRDTDDILHVCDAFVDTVYCIVSSLCSSLSMGKRPYLFEVNCLDTNSVNRLSVSTRPAERHSLFDKYVLHVPPFKKGSDAAYSFVFALTEPLINALRALDELGQMQGLSTSERTLRVNISPHLPEEVVFSVINSSSVRIQKKLSGFETTRRMLRRVGIADISNPRVTRIRSGLYEITAVVHFRPYELANKIADKLERRHAAQFDIASDR
jgi:hypothetical protein